MTKRHMIAFFSLLIVMMFVVSIQANARDHGFTTKSVEGTYYIPCACEGNEVSSGGSIHSAGMGKIYFDGKGQATITQQNLYTEIGNVITRIIKDGIVVEEGYPGRIFKGSYEVNSEGYGLLFDGAFPPKESDYTPSFMVTKVKDRKPVEIYLILPQNFIDFTMEPKHLIHVTAVRR
jgi:hypothetical protein